MIPSLWDGGRRQGVQQNKVSSAGFQQVGNLRYDFVHGSGARRGELRRFRRFLNAPWDLANQSGRKTVKSGSASSFTMNSQQSLIPYLCDSSTTLERFSNSIARRGL